MSFLYIIIYNPQHRIYSPLLPVLPNLPNDYQWVDLHFPYPNYFFKFMVQSPNGNILIFPELVRVAKSKEKFEHIELIQYTVRINEGLKITCMINSVYLGRVNVCKTKTKLKYKWLASHELMTFGLSSPRRENSLHSLKDEANDLKLIRQAISAGFDMSSVFIESIEKNDYVPDSETFQNDNYKLPCVINENDRFIRLKIYNFKFTPPKCAEILFKVVIRRKKLKAKAFGGRLKAYIEMDGVKITKLVIVTDEETLEFNKIQKSMTV